MKEVNECFRQIDPYDDQTVAITFYDGSNDEDPSITLIAAVRKKKLYLIRCDAFMRVKIFKKGHMTEKRMPIVIGYREFAYTKDAKKELTKLIGKFATRNYTVNDILVTSDIGKVLPRHDIGFNGLASITYDFLDDPKILKIRKTADTILKNVYPYYDDMNISKTPVGIFKAPVPCNEE